MGNRSETDFVDNLYSPFTVALDSAMDLVTPALVLVLVELVAGEDHAEVEHQEQDDGGGEAECGHHQPLLELHDYTDSELAARAH